MKVVIGVRSRVLATMLAFSAVAMTVAGGTLLLVQQRRLLERVDSGIAADVSQFRSLAAGELGPQDAPPFPDVDSLLEVAVQRQVPAEDQTSLALVNGVPRFVPSGERPVQLEFEDALIDLLAGLPPSEPARIRTVDTAAGPVRYAAVQVTIEGSADVGTYVVAYALRPGQGALADAGRLYAIVAAISLALVGVVGWVVAGRLLRPLRVLRAAAEDISHTDLSLRIPVTGNDDISELTATVNAMLSRLQAAFDTQQQFLDDAGHELRTPLTVVRGHLEVLDSSKTFEVEETRALVLDELDRMARLVSDLTMLARSRRPDFTRPGPVDVDHLLATVLEKVSALGDRQWLIEATVHVRLLADQQRLTQALLQLSDNAVKHTAPGDVIALGAALGPRWVSLWVRDSGEGIPPADLGRIFERFGRAATFGSGRGDEGSGLGLAIVSAIAVAHGGEARVASIVGEGSTFAIVLPTSALIQAPAELPPVRIGTMSGGVR